MTINEDVLIVGAGPTGLVLALELAYYNVPFRIIDKAKGPGETSRAMLLIPRVLESYQKFDLDEEVIAGSVRIQEIIYHIKDERKTEVELGHFGQGKSAYPFVLTYPQDEHEKLLIRKLNEYGIEVEWETELHSIVDKGSKVETTLTNEQAQFSYVIGCDGASSQVRKQADISFEGDTYEHVFYVMDAVVEGNVIVPDAGSFSFADDFFTVFFPLKNTENKRLIGMIPTELTEKEDFSYESLKPYLERTHSLTIHKKNWFSEYKIHRRVATHYQKNRILLAGDAAHIHSPVGGQGMNAGIGDAVNLGWKLATVIHQQAEPSLLETYEQERKPFAKWLVSTTDRAFKQIATPTSWKQTLRNTAVPLFAKAVRHSQTVKEAMYTVLSQLYVQYNQSDLSQGRYGKIKGGMRLPYSDGESLEFMREDDWQLHVFKQPDLALTKWMEDKRIQVVERKWTDKTKKNHFKRDGLYLVRPDGHIGWVGQASEAAKLKAYVHYYIK